MLEKIPSEEFHYLDGWQVPDDRYKVKLPQLVLGIKHWHDYRRKFNFKEPEKWLHIEHQTAGHGCHHHQITGRLLTPTPQMQIFMYETDKNWLDSCVGVWGVHLDDILEYRKQLQTQGLDCGESYPSFEEGIYPIDCSVEIVRKVCTDEIPDDLDDFIEWGENPGFEKIAGSVGRWGLFILGENCD